MLMTSSSACGKTIVKIGANRLDAAVAPEFKDGMVALIDAGSTRFVLDFSKVDFIDSSGLGALVGIYKLVNGRGSLELACLGPAVEKVFALTRMNRVFEIHDAVPAA
ncbi:MAG: STAS domain-containing protein [Pseudomonadota bacterium]